MRLRHLDADRPAADDHEMLWPVRRPEYAFIGKIRNAVQARDRRDCRTRSGRHHDAARLDPNVAGFDLRGADEPRLALDDADSEPGEALDRVHRLYGGDGGADMRMHGSEVDRRLVPIDAEDRRAAYGRCRLGGGQEGLGRHAAIVEAVAAHLALFDEHDGGAHLRGAGSHGKPAGTRTDHADVNAEPLAHQTPPKTATIIAPAAARRN